MLIRHGSLKVLHLSGDLATPKVNWNGVFYDEIIENEMPQLDLDGREKDKVHKILKGIPIVQGYEEMYAEIQTMHRVQKNAYINSLGTSQYIELLKKYIKQIEDGTIQNK